jgi:hypothetical protein
VVVHVCNPSIQGAEAGGSRVLCQTGLHKKTLSQKKKKKKRFVTLIFDKLQCEYYVKLLEICPPANSIIRTLGM